jgi:hypothetical protein
MFSIVHDYRYARYHSDVSRLARLLASYAIYSLFVIYGCR